MKLGECFAYYGAVPRNPRWSWSARSPDGKTVVMTLWKDRLSSIGGLTVYDDRGIDTARWKDRPGNRERIENLVWARDRCDGYFRTIITVARDTTAQPRQIRECYLQKNLNMRLTDLDAVSGEFRAVHVPLWPRHRPISAPIMIRVGGP